MRLIVLYYERKYFYLLLELVDLALELAGLLDDRLVLRLDRVRCEHRALFMCIMSNERCEQQ